MTFDTGRTLPVIDELTAPWWDAARAGRLTLQRCKSCDRHQWPPATLCLKCSGDVDWVDAEGTATIYTFSVIYRSSHPAPSTPYVLAVIALPEGVTMTTNVVTDDPDSLAVGDPLRVDFEPISEEWSLPIFRQA